MPEPTTTPDERLAEIAARTAAATGDDWHWAGNVDTGEPYLATWIPGAGRCSVLTIGSEDRSATGRDADHVREFALDSGLDPEELIEEWATDRFGQPIKEPRLWFFTDLMADPARKHVVFEVAPNATDRDDPKVYRADITGIRHPDAEFIAHSRADVSWLLAEVERLKEELRRQEVMHKAYRPEVVAEVAVNLSAHEDWEEIAAWCGGRIVNSQDQSGEYSSTLVLPNGERGGEWAWLVLDHDGEFHFRAEVEAPKAICGGGPRA